MTAQLAREGFISFRGYRTYYQIIGGDTQKLSGKFPVLALHGRPPSHEALEPLQGLAERDRAVIFYDQLGCGRSDRPDDPSLWSINLFVDELHQVRRELNLDQVHILGHSWGGIVAMEYALQHPNGIVSLILSSTYASRAMLDADFNRLRKALPREVFETLLKHESSGTIDDPAYKQANEVFNLRHICRVDPWPDYLIKSLDNPPAGKVNTDGLDMRKRLVQIRIPTLITCGRYDCCTPAQAEIINKRIPGSELVIFEESSHYAHIEETKRYLSVVKDFMNRVERQIHDKT